MAFLQITVPCVRNDNMIHIKDFFKLTAIDLVPRFIINNQVKVHIICLTVNYGLCETYHDGIKYTIINCLLCCDI